MQNLEDLNTQISHNKLNGWEDLTEQQKLFGMRYVESYVIKRAAEEAGISALKASKWLRDPLMLEYIGELQALLNGRSIINKDFIALQFLNLLPKLMGEEEVPIIFAGEMISTKKFFANETVSVLRELAKSTDFYNDGEGQGSSAEQIADALNRLAGNLPE